MPLYNGYLDFRLNVFHGLMDHMLDDLWTTALDGSLHLPLQHTNRGKQAFIYHAAKNWNSLPIDFKYINFLSIFKSKLKPSFKTFLIN